MALISAIKKNPDRIKIGAIFIALFALLAWLYIPVLDYPYIWDDMLVRQARQYFLLPSPLQEAFGVPFMSLNYYRPLPVLTMIYETRIAGGVVEWQQLGHLINYSLFLALITAVWWLGYFLLPDTKIMLRSIIATLMTVIVALHPANIIGAAWVSARFDLGMTLFAVLLLCCDQGIAGAWRRALCVGVLFLMATLCKESAVSIIIFLPLWHLCRDGFLEGRSLSWWQHIRNHGYDKTYFVVGIACVLYLFIRYQGLGYLLVAEEGMPDRGTLLQAALLVGKTFILYTQLFFLPFNILAPAYPQKIPLATADLAAWLGLLLFMSMVIGGVWLSVVRKSRLGLMMLVWLGLLLPLLNLKQIPLPDSIADLRYLSLPITLIVLLIAAVCSRSLPYVSSRSCKIVFIMCTAWILAATINFNRSLGVWQNDLVFWRWYLETVPDSPVANLNYSAALRKAGFFEESIEQARIALKKYPEQNDVGALLNIILSQIKLGRYKQAEQSVRDYLKIVYSPRPVATGNTLLADVLMSQGKFDEAAPALKLALELDPDNIKIRVQKIRWLFLQGQHQQAIKETSRALSLLDGNHLLLKQLMSEDGQMPAEQIIMLSLNLNNQGDDL